MINFIKYLEEIKKYKRLDKEEERKLLEQKEYEKVFHANLHIAVDIASRFSLLTKSIYPMDLIQEANIILLDTIKKYKCESKTDFTHYLGMIVYQNLKKMLISESKMLKISNDYFNKIADYIRILELDELGYSEDYNSKIYDMWKDFEEKYYKDEFSEMWEELPLLKSTRDEVISLNNIDKQELGTYDIEDDINCMFDRMLLLQILKEMNLSKKEKLVLYYLYFNEKKYSETEIAKKLHLSRSRINYIKRFLLLKIKYKFTYQSKIDKLNKKKVLK